MEAKVADILFERIQKEAMIAFVQKNDQNFSEAIDLVLGNQYPLSWRASWILGHAMKKNDGRIRPYVDKLIDLIEPAEHDGQQRELMKLLFKMKLDEEQEGKLFDICMNLWEKIGKTPSVRSTAFKFILDIIKKYPELKEEIAFVMEPQYIEPLSPGIQRSIKKQLAAINMKVVE
ncbi:hypothetical protein [Sediminitomix flava]|uniref:HEAT repeat protein n=1 Tax=Sediminitomix flava TaxID=379075 RepID=A0A315Z5U3_SEDFL|nr:hypothetical protein [Sediminitomix flava]PWJ39273.1 hypothetical protein BC781_106174 [Sediminitomix flava]